MKHIGVLTSGGDSPGMNAAIRAVVRTARYHGLKVCGIPRGFQGLIDGDLCQLSSRDVGGIIDRGGTILRSHRCKAFFEEEGRAKAAATIKKHNVDGLVLIGGDGTYRGGLKLFEEHGIPSIGVPGTIDNDIGGTDYTIGYDTALNTALDAIDRIRDTATSHDRIFFIEVMGRNSGYLAMMSAIAGGAEDVLVPETPTDIDELVGEFRRHEKAGKMANIVVVAEGDEEGNAMEIARKVKEQSSFTRIRVTVIGHLQRGGSPTAFDRVLASRLGLRAVEALMEGESAKMVGVSGRDVVLRPYADAWDCSSRFDPSYERLAEILAT